MSAYAPRNFYNPARHGKSECIPLVPKRSRPLLSVAEAMQYEEVLSDLECAMREVHTEQVHELMAQLNQLSERLRQQPGLAAYLERGRYGSAARERLKKEYISRYVLLRGGGPTDQERWTPEAPPDSTQMDNQMEKAPLTDPGDGYLTELTDQAVRHGFIQKVYGILCAQLLLTTLIGGLTMSQLGDASEGLVRACFFLSLIIMIGTMCVCMCNPGLMRTYPINYVILLVFTLAESVLVGFVGAQYTAESVLIVVCITALVVFGLSLFACQTSYDFSGWGPYLLCALLVMCGLSFCFLIAALLGMASSPAFQTMRLVFAGFGAMLFSFYIVYDTQLIMGGKHKNMFAIDDYCMAAMSLYIDIIQLFLYLLELFGGRK